MDFGELKMSVRRAIDKFYARDSALLRQDASEWTISHRLAVYLEQEIPGWNVDCEYNRQRGACDEKRNDDGQIVRPDIILHHRTETTLQHNLLAIEVKKREEDSDLEKVCTYTAPPTANRPFQYQYGLALSFLPTLKTPWFESGAERVQNGDALQPMLLYRFLNAQYALKTIEERRFKISRIRELNDPFEWRLGGITGVIPEDQSLANAIIESLIDHNNGFMGILCFCNTVKEPVLWSHYADHHRGVAFEVSVTPDPAHVIRMSYSPERPVLDANVCNSLFHDRAELDKYLTPLIMGLMNQKSPGWAYEQEYRLHFALHSLEIAKGLYFKRIPDGFLKRVILGWGCPLEGHYVVKALKAQGLAGVDVVRAKLCSTTYTVECC
jgi:hypothetical protein